MRGILEDRRRRGDETKKSDKERRDGGCGEKNNNKREFKRCFFINSCRDKETEISFLCMCQIK